MLAAPVASHRRYDGPHAAHAHDFVQVLLGWQGTLVLDLHGRAARVEPGTALVIPAGLRHGFATTPGQPARALVIDAPPAAGLEHVRVLACPAAWADPAARPDAVALLQALGAAPRRLPRRRLDLARLADAIDAALHEPWPTVRLAALVGMSAPQFHARFLERCGLPPQAWLRARRLDRAQALLAAGLGLDAVALQVGYASASALAHALRRDRGLGARTLRAARVPSRP